MNLEVLNARKLEIEQALVNTANQYQVLLGHKHEVDYMINQLNSVEPCEPPAVE